MEKIKIEKRGKGKKRMEKEREKGNRGLRKLDSVP